MSKQFELTTSSLRMDKIESIQEIEAEEHEYVYDLEVEDKSNTFFANDIWIHNSLFMSYTEVMKSAGWKGDPIEFILKLYECKLEDLNIQILDEWAAKYNVENLHEFELEKIANIAILLRKKKYLMNLKWVEGITFDSYNILYKGIDIVRSDTPPFVRDNFTRIIKYFLDNPDTYNIKELNNMVREIKREFEASDIEYISMQKGLGKYNEYVLNDEDDLVLGEKCPPQIRAAATHNYLLSQNPKYLTKYEKIKRGDKVKFYYTKNKQYPIFGFIRDKYPIEIALELAPMDYETQFEKVFISFVNRFNEALDLPNINKRLNIVNALFGINNFKKKQIT